MKMDCGCEFEINAKGNPILDYNKIRMDCPKVYEMIGQGYTVGSFQLESNLGKNWCKAVKPTNINEISDVISLIRPGVLQSYLDGKNLAQHYVDRKTGKEEVKGPHESLDKILSKTYSVMLYQEQISEIAQKLANFNLSEADELRKGIGKKDPQLLASLKQKFIDGAKYVGVLTEDQANEIFGWIQSSARYLFNFSHGVSYAISAYYSAYAKAHFPLQFFTSYLIHADDKQNPLAERRRLVEDAKNFNIEVLPPSLLNIEDNIHISGKNTISFGIANIKGMGTSLLDKVKLKLKEVEVQLSKPLKMWTWMEYLVHFMNNVSTTANNGLILTGACDWLGISRHQMSFEYDIWNKVTPREAAYIKSNLGNTLVESLYNLLNAITIKLTEKRRAIIQSLISTLENPPTSLYDSPEWIAWNEEKLLGISLSCHKVDGCSRGVEATHTCKDVYIGKPKYAVVAVQIARLKVVTTKNGKNPGQKMAFVDLSDGTYTLEGLPCFSDTWRDVSSLIQEENTVCCQLGKLQDGGYSIQKVWQI